MSVQTSYPRGFFVAIFRCFLRFIFSMGRRREQRSDLASWSTRVKFELEAAIVVSELYHLVVDKRSAFNQNREESSGDHCLNTGFS